MNVPLLPRMIFIGTWLLGGLLLYSAGATPRAAVSLGLFAGLILGFITYRKPVHTDSEN